MRILVETGTESVWVAQTLEAAGHEKEQPAVVYGCHRSPHAVHTSESSTKPAPCNAISACRRRVSDWRRPLRDSGPMRILVQTGTESEWVAQTLDGGARDGRGRSELRVDVRRAAASGEDRSARRRRAGRGQSTRLVSGGPSDLGRAADDAAGVAGASADRPAAEWRRRADPLAGETRGRSAAELRRHKDTKPNRSSLCIRVFVIVVLRVSPSRSLTVLR